MPGGVKNWASGQTLDAADLNDYVANQVIARFATIAARTAAYGVAGAPALQSGLFAYVESTEKLYYYDGTSWDEVGAQVEDGEIVTVKLADGAVTTVKLADSAVTTIKLADANVTTAKIADSNVTTAKIADANVTTAKIQDGAVTSAKIADGTIVNADLNASAEIALSKLATSTSSQLASIISDETGSGALVFGTSPTITPAEGTTTNAHNSAGYLGMPQVLVTSGGRTLQATDAGKHILVTTNNNQAIAIPANSSAAFPIGTTIVIVAGTVSGTTVTITSDTLRLANSASTGTRNIAAYGMGTLLKINTTEWILTGNGVT